MTFPGIFPIAHWKSVADSYLNSPTQYVEITIAAGATSGTATITAVGSLAFVLHGFFTCAGLNGNSTYSRIDLTNSTTVTATRNTSDAGNAVVVRACVVDPSSSLVESVEQGTIGFTAGVGSNTATIAGVDTSRSTAIWIGQINNTSTAASTSAYCSVTLTNGTTVTGTRSGTSGTATVGFVVVQFQAAVIQSVQQYNTALTSNGTVSNATVSAVTMANSILFYGGVHSSVAAFVSTFYRCELTGTTNVAMTRTGTSTSSKTPRWTLVEFVSGVLTSLQRGTTSISGATSADTTITGVTTGNALISVCGFSATGTTQDETQASAKLLNSTTVRGQKNTAAQTSTLAWTVVEFA